MVLDHLADVKMTEQIVVLSEKYRDEIYDLISKNRIKDISDPRYSNQNFLNLYGVK